MTGEQNVATEQEPQVHHPDCGDVGETGEHGDLGANAVNHPDRLAPSAEALDAAAQEQAEKDATAAAETTAEAEITAGLLKAGYSPEDAASMARTAVKAKQTVASGE